MKKLNKKLNDELMKLKNKYKVRSLCKLKKKKLLYLDFNKN